MNRLELESLLEVLAVLEGGRWRERERDGNC